MKKWTPNELGNVGRAAQRPYAIFRAGGQCPPDPQAPPDNEWDEQDVPREMRQPLDVPDKCMDE